MNNLLTPARDAITIRLAIPEDAPALHALRLEALTAYPEVFSADAPATAAESARFWAERIAQNAAENTGIICVAVVGEQLIGMLGLARGQRPKTRHSATVWGVYVKEEWRGLRIAEALLKRCLAWALAQGIVIAKLAVVTTNTPAIRCYIRCGFIIYGLEPQAIFYNDTYYDELLMAKRL